MPNAPSSGAQIAFLILMIVGFALIGYGAVRIFVLGHEFSPVPFSVGALTIVGAAVP